MRFLTRIANVLLAGEETSPLTRCLGLRVRVSILDSGRVIGPSGQRRRGVTTTLVQDTATRVRRNPLGVALECPGVAIASIDTILRTQRGEQILVHE